MKVQIVFCVDRKLWIKELVDLNDNLICILAIEHDRLKLDIDSVTIKQLEKYFIKRQEVLI